ncbi:MAG: TRAP transporter substrate-binding protein, partial [Pseudolabrys sp.]
MLSIRKTACGIALVALVTAWVSTAMAQEAKHYRFAYDQPKTTGYGIAGDLFADKLKELSKGTMLIDQYPGAQLGQEPQVLQLVKAGDVEFCISSSANAATLTPQAGVMSLHFLFRSEDHLVKALADPQVTKAVKDMVEDTVQGAHVIAVITLGLRNMYSKKPIAKIEDMKGLKVRVQATPTEDLMFPVYGAQTVHMPFGSVYTSLQTGVVDVAENGVNVYQANKHYEVAPVLSMTEHEANNNLIWISDKLWKSLTDEQKKWVQTAADEVSNKEPASRPLQWRLLHGLDQILDLDRMGPKLGGQLVEIGIGQLLKAGLVDAGDDLDAERFEFVGRLVLEVDGL